MAHLRRSQNASNFLGKSKYYNRIRELNDVYPHLASLSNHMEVCEEQRLKGEIGSPASDSMLLAEIDNYGGVNYNSINACEEKDLAKHELALHGKASRKDDFSTVSARIIVVEDMSPAAMEVLGTGFDLDPHIFYFHMGFDKQSANATDIPVVFCMPGHAPKDFISIAVPCDLIQPIENEYKDHKTYSRQSYKPLVDDTSDTFGSSDFKPVSRAYQRYSLVFRSMDNVPTTIILTYPTWKTRSIWQAQHHGARVPFFFDAYDDCFKDHKRMLDISLEMQGESVFQGQWRLVQPLLESLIYEFCCDPTLPRHVCLRRHSLLWLYSVMSRNYNLASQNEARCWLEMERLLDKFENTETSFQKTKTQIRNTMKETVEQLETSRLWMEDTWARIVALGGKPPEAVHETLCGLRLETESTLRYEKAKIGGVQRHIDDFQHQVEMKVMIAKLKRALTPPASPSLHATEESPRARRCRCHAHPIVYLERTCH